MSTTKKPRPPTRAQLQLQIAHLNAQIIQVTANIDDRMARNIEIRDERDLARSEVKRAREQQAQAEFELKQLRDLIVEYSLLASNSVTSDDKERVIQLQRMIAGTQQFPMPQRQAKHNFAGLEPGERRY